MSSKREIVKSVVQDLGKSGSTAKAVLEVLKKNYSNEDWSSDKTVTHYTSLARKELGFVQERAKSITISVDDIKEAKNFASNVTLPLTDCLSIIDQLKDVKNLGKLENALKFLQDNDMLPQTSLES